MAVGQVTLRSFLGKADRLGLGEGRDHHWKEVTTACLVGDSRKLGESYTC